MKNILIISSSPRKKGNSQILCEQFKKGAEAKGHQVKIVRIMEQNIFVPCIRNVESSGAVTLIFRFMRSGCG